MHFTGLLSGVGNLTSSEVDHSTASPPGSFFNSHIETSVFLMNNYYNNDIHEKTSTN